MTNNSTELALNFLCKRMPYEMDMPHEQYVYLLMDFQDKKGDNAIEGLAGFYLFAIRNIGGEKGNNAIHETFVHDLGGRNETSCLPKSDGYIQIWRDEVNK